MSTFDINKIVNFLQSSKTKERNDALTLLENLPTQKLKLTLKQFNLITTSIFKLIEIEAGLYRNNKSNPVETRLFKSSNFLVSLIEKCNNDANRFHDQKYPDSTSIKLKYKNYLNLINSTIDCFFIDFESAFLDPCAFDFISIINICLDENLVREHLHYDNWIRIYNFLIKITNLCLSTSTNNILSGQNDKFLFKCFQCIQYLTEATRNVSNLHLLKNENYFKLLPLIKKTFQIYNKKETNILITVLKIINKLLIVSSNQDARFINQLIQQVIKVFIQFNQSQFDSLQTQFLIFLNLESVLNYISLHKLPNQIGGESKNNMVVPSDDIDSNDLSVRSDPEEEDNLDADSALNEEDREVILYNTGVLILHLLSKLSSPEFYLNQTEIGLALHSGKNSWFQLRSLFLISDTSSNPKPWLLHLGIAKLIQSYYTLKLSIMELKDTSRVNTTNILGQPPNQFTSFQKSKRQKLGHIGDSLYDSNNSLEFLNSLIIHKADEKIQEIGMKILMFFLEDVESLNPETQEQETLPEQIVSNPPTSDGESSVLNVNESTLLNSTFGFQLDTPETLAKFDKDIIFKNILSSFDNSNLTFWSLHSSFCLINNLALNNTKLDSHYQLRRLYQLLKITLPLIKHKLMGSAACDLYYLIILYYGEVCSNKIIEESIMSQLDNIIDLAEINGPHQICDSSFRFWFSIDKVYKEINSTNRNTLPEKIQDWVLAKWDSILEIDNSLKTVNINLPRYSLFPDFVVWLCGCDITLLIKNSHFEGYENALNATFQFSDQYSELQNFINLKINHSPQLTNQSFEVSSMDALNDVSEKILTKLLDAANLLTTYESNSISVFRWMMLLFKIGSFLYEKRKYSHILSAIDYRCSTMLEIIRDYEIDEDELSELIKDFNSFEFQHLSRNFSNRIAEVFPYDKLKSSFLPKASGSSKAKNIPLSSVFDDEFLSASPEPLISTPKPVSLTYTDSLCEIHTSSNVVQFIIAYHRLRESSPNDTFTALIHYFKSMDTLDVLFALNSLIDVIMHGEFQIEGIYEENLTKIIRIFGEGPMSNHKIERNELTVIILCKLLNCFLPNVRLSYDGGFKKDFYDLCGFAFHCASKDLIITEASILEFTKLIVSLLTFKEESVIPNTEARVMLVDTFKQFPNNTKIKFLPSLCYYMNNLSTSDQTKLYTDLYLGFDLPQQSIELAGTFSLFFSQVSQNSSQLTIAAIYNLIEYSRYKFFTPYSKFAIDIIRSHLGLKNPKSLFKLFRFEVLKFWIGYGLDIMEFPFTLFGYNDGGKFLKDNYQEISALALSSKNNQFESELLVQLARIKRVSVKDIVSDCLSLAVALSFTGDSIKTNIFVKLSDYLQDRYKTEIKRKLPIIIFEIIKYTDVSNEHISITRKEFTGISVPNTLKSSKGLVSISYLSSMELLKSLAHKFFGNEQDFWLIRIVYFLVRRLQLLLSNSIVTDQKEQYIKLIKFVISIGARGCKDLALTKLLILAAIPYLDNPSLHPHAVDILNTVKIEGLNGYGTANTIWLIVKLTSELFNKQSSFQALVISIEKYSKSLDGSIRLRSVLLKASLILQGHSCLITTADLECILGDPSLYLYFPSKTQQKDLVMFLSRIYTSFNQNNSFMEVEIDKTLIVKVLLSVKLKEIVGTSTSFGIWATNFLSDFYLNSQALKNIDSIIDLEEYGADMNINFKDRIETMNTILEIILKYLHEGTIEEAACAESILGVLIYRFESSISDEKYIQLSRYFEKFNAYIAPIEFHSCILLNTYDEDLFVTGETLDNLISHFLTTFSTCNFDLWTSRFLLALIQELSKYTSMAVLLSTFVFQVNGFAKEALPDFICYFIGLSGDAGSDIILRVINEYIKLQNKTKELVSLFSKVVLLVRMGAKSKIPVFEKMYQKIDLESFYRLAAKNKQYKTALLFFEEFCNRSEDSNILSHDSKILSEIYNSIDDEDLIYGLPEKTSLDYTLSMISRSADAQERVQYNSGLLDASLSLRSGPPYEENMLLSMLDNGLLGASRLLSKGSGYSNNKQNYEWAWKLNKWDISIPKTARGEHEHIYKTLKQIQDYPKQALDLFHSSQLEILLSKDEIPMKSASSKDLRSNTLEWFKTTAVLSGIGNIIETDLQITNISDLQTQFYNKTSWFDDADFDVSENILLARRVTFQLLTEMKDTDVVNSLFSELVNGLAYELYRYGALARQSKALQKMIGSTILFNEAIKKFHLQLPEDLSQSLSSVCTYQSACTLWDQGKSVSPVAMLRDLLSKKPINLPIPMMNIDQRLIAAKLVLWMSDSRQDLASNIMDKYVLSITDQIESMENVQQKLLVYQLLAHFCEQQFKSHTTREMISKMNKRVNEKHSKLEEIKSHFRSVPVPTEDKVSIQKYYTKLKSELNSDRAELNSLKDNSDNFRNKAVQFYLKSIIINDKSGEDLDKFISFFLEFSHADELQNLLAGDINHIPTYKLIGWSTQLVSRISDESINFQGLLRKLILKLCRDHPYHSLYQLFSMKKHEGVAVKDSNTAMEAKTNVAKKMLQDLYSNGSSKTYISEILNPIERLCDKSISLAEYKGSKGRSINLKKVSIGSYWMENLPPIPPPTISLPISHTGYRDVVKMSYMEPTLSIAMSGLSLPKIAKFRLSDGTMHKCLFKSGADDLRQDSIMEQVFEKVNEIFSTDKETRKRQLKVRTYKAVPLGPQAGIIEFVANSEAFIEIIKPYHAKDSLKMDKARSMMKNCQNGGKGERLKVYESITKKIKPVFRYFFFDNFLTPDKWLACRTKYTRGIATTSMVGYILGLGDRHCNNILIDTNTGEPVHIDLGVAFDQGKRLPIPETVPFRLTRDIVDGFGVTETRGGFSKSCEHTFRVLRSNKEHILAILDVLRWDPLYAWTISPIKKKKLQEETTIDRRIAPEDDASEAGVAVSTVADKLIGEGLSVEAVVRELIQEATSPEQLALIYCGWSPFY